MKPPMPKLDVGVLTLKQPQLDDTGIPVTDDYGMPITHDVPVAQARIRRSTKFIQGRDGQTHQCILEIDFPPEATFSEGDGTEYYPSGSAPVSGKVISINESVNLAGTKAYFRTAYVE